MYLKLNDASVNNMIIPSSTRSLFSLALFRRSIRYKKNLLAVNETKNPKIYVAGIGDGEDFK